MRVHRYTASEQSGIERRLAAALRPVPALVADGGDGHSALVRGGASHSFPWSGST